MSRNSAKPIVTFITGAGFSKGFGLPIQDELWDICLTPSEYSKRYEEFDYAILKREPLRRFIREGSKNIEKLVSEWEKIIEQKESNGQHSSSAQFSGMSDYYAYLTNLCSHLIEKGNEGESSYSFKEFKNWLRKELCNFQFRFISLNYDLMIEKVLTLDSSSNKRDFRKEVYLDSGKLFHIRKLHGSVHWIWARDDNSKRVMDGYKPKAIFQDEEGYIIDAPDDLSDVAYIALNATFPVIIPPTVQKRYSGIFKEIKSKAEEDLRHSEYVIIIGYSFRDIDTVVRDFLKGAADKYQWKRFVYLNPQLEDCQKAEQIFGEKLECIDDEWSIQIFDEILSYEETPNA